MAQDDTTNLDAFGEFGVPAHVIEKNSREQVRIGISEFSGNEYIDIRTFFQSPDGFRPTRRGVTVPTRLYPELLKGVIELGWALGMIDPETLSDETGPPGDRGARDGLEGKGGSNGG